MSSDPVDAYREIAPSARLERFVECFWISEHSGASSDPLRVLPDGCVDLLFELDAARDDDAGRVVGAMTRPFLADRSRSRRFAAVRFRPGGAALFVRAPQSELVDDVAAVADLVPCGRELTARVAGAPSTFAAVKRLESNLVARLARAARPRWTLSAAARIAADPVATSVGRLALELGVSRQHLARAFRRDVGLSPKMLARVMRLRALTGSLARGEEPRWARLAARFGYADQSHLVSETRALAGLTPTQLAGSISARRESAAG